MAYDPFKSVLDALSGSGKINTSPLQEKSLNQQRQFADTVGRSTLLAGGTGVDEAMINSLGTDLLGIDYGITKDQNQITKSILGGQNVNTFLKAWRGYVTQRQQQVDTSRLRPGSKQTFLGGDI